MGHQAGGISKAMTPHWMEATIAAAKNSAAPSHGMLGIPAGPGGLLQSNQINGSSDMSGLQAFSFEHIQGFFTTDNIIIVSSLMMMWWLTNRFLEGVTTAMVYSHLTEGRLGQILRSLRGRLPKSTGYCLPRHRNTYLQENRQLPSQQESRRRTRHGIQLPCRHC